MLRVLFMCAIWINLENSFAWKRRWRHQLVFAYFPFTMYHNKNEQQAEKRKWYQSSRKMLQKHNTEKSRDENIFSITANEANNMRWFFPFCCGCDISCMCGLGLWVVMSHVTDTFCFRSQRALTVFSNNIFLIAVTKTENKWKWRMKKKKKKRTTPYSTSWQNREKSTVVRARAWMWKRWCSLLRCCSRLFVIYKNFANSISFVQMGDRDRVCGVGLVQMSSSPMSNKMITK